MIKFFALIPRRPDISAHEFHDHYRHPHGTLGAQLPHFRGYVQSHQVHSDLLGADQADFEAIAEVWFDNDSDAVGFLEAPHYVEHVKPDEPSFIDMDKMKFVYTSEQVIASGPDLASSLTLADRLLDRMDIERPVTIKLLHFAQDDGGAGGYEMLASRLGAVRHVHCQTRAALHAGGPAAFATVDELWWATIWDFEQAVARGSGLDELLKRPGSVTLLATAERFI
jgi:uncharacterized protein (TIGR02118 family)